MQKWIFPGKNAFIVLRSRRTATDERLLTRTGKLMTSQWWRHSDDVTMMPMTFIRCQSSASQCPYISPARHVQYRLLLQPMNALTEPRGIWGERTPTLHFLKIWVSKFVQICIEIVRVVWGWGRLKNIYAVCGQ